MLGIIWLLYLLYFTAYPQRAEITFGHSTVKTSLLTACNPKLFIPTINSINCVVSKRFRMLERDYDRQRGRGRGEELNANNALIWDSNAGRDLVFRCLLLEYSSVFGPKKYVKWLINWQRICRRGWRRGRGAWGLRAERKTGRRVVVVLVEHVFQKIPGRSSNAAGQKNQRNKTSRTLRNVQSSRISCSSSCSCSPFFFFFFVMTHCQVQMSRQTDSGDATWIHVSTIFLVLLLLHAPVAVAVALGYRAQNIAPSSRRLSPKRYRSENISNCRHFGYFIWRIWRMGAGRAYRVERARLRGTLRTLTIQLWREEVRKNCR